MWGGSGTGKTTFLGVLDIALNRKDYGLTMTGADDASVDMLTEMTETINDRREFPPATQSIDVFKWDIYSVRPPHPPPGGTAAPPTRPFKITLKLTDPSGELMKRGQRSNPDRKKLIDDIVDSTGILFMFDPIREFAQGDAFSTTNGVLKQLLLAFASKDPAKFTGRLPHYVAVCITKFDEPRILETARRMGVLRRDPHDPHDLPWVHNNDARKLLNSLTMVSGSGDGDMIVNALNTHFYPERVSYFVTSAVGLYVNPQTQKFDIDDPQNLIKNSAGMSNSARIRGPVRPFNIVEPVLWLSEQISQSH
jgi:hypothetical protein